MKLRNKKTGEIGEPRIQYQEIYIDTENHMTYCYKSLQGVFEEWEDYNEPKKYWCIDWTGGVNHLTVLDGIDEYEKAKKEIGNYFEAREEAEKAVEKLKAWKRLRDSGFRFNGWNWETQCIEFDFNNSDITEGQVEEANDDLDILFSEVKNEN